MRVKVKVDFNTSKILASRGLGGTNKVRKYLASEVVSQSHKYTPFQQGLLASSAQIAADGSQIVYPGPYAHYQWVGEVYGPNYTNGERFWSGAPKNPTGRKLTYSGGPMRGPRWTKRMLADKRHEIEKNVENYIKKG